MTRFLSVLAVVIGLGAAYEFWGADRLGTPHIFSQTTTNRVMPHPSGIWIRTTEPDGTLSFDKKGSRTLCYTVSNGFYLCKGDATRTMQDDLALYKFESIGGLPDDIEVRGVSPDQSIHGETFIYTGRIAFTMNDAIHTVRRCDFKIFRKLPELERRLVLSNTRTGSGAGTCRDLSGSYTFSRL